VPVPVLSPLYDFLLQLLTPAHVKARPAQVAAPAEPGDAAAIVAGAIWNGLAYEVPPPRIVRGETYVVPQTAQHSANEIPFVPALDKIPGVGPVLTAPIKVGLTLAYALGYSDQVDLNEFDPWQNPADAQTSRGLVLRMIGTQIEKYDIPSGRMLNPDGTVAVIDTRVMDKTGQLIDPADREKYGLWKMRHLAAVRFNYDRSKVGPDGYTPIPVTAELTPANAPQEGYSAPPIESFPPEVQAEITQAVQAQYDATITAGENAGGGDVWDGMNSAIY
jgi:hypothetical protein